MILLAKVGSKYNTPLKTYICDTDEDLSSMVDISMGMRAYVISAKKFYICDSNGTWNEIPEDIIKLI